MLEQLLGTYRSLKVLKSWITQENNQDGWNSSDYCSELDNRRIKGTLWTRDTIYIPISWWRNYKTYDTNNKFVQQRMRAKTSGRSLV
jgi:hypothetical protein